MSEGGAEGLASKRGGLTVSMMLALVAAIGVGLAVTRTLPDFLFLDERRDIVYQFSASGTGTSSSSYSVGPGGNNLSRFPGLASWSRASYWLDHVPYWSGPWLVSLTFAAMALGLRRPRTRRAARLPGRVVGIAVLLAMMVKLLECVILLMTW